MNSTQGVLEAVNGLFYAIEAETPAENVYFYSQPLDTLAKDLQNPTDAMRHKIRYEAVKDALQSAGQDNIPAGSLYVMQFNIAVSDYIKREGMIDAMLRRPRVFKKLTPAAVRKYAGMKTADFAQLLYDICTDKGSKLTPADDEANGYKSPQLLERCLYAAYVYSQVAAYLDYQTTTFLPVPMPNGIMQLPFINSGKKEIDELEGNGIIKVGDTTFRVKKGLRK